MCRDIFNPLFDLQDARLDKLGNTLLALDRLVDWEAFRSLLERALGKEREPRRRSRPEHCLGVPRAPTARGLGAGWNVFGAQSALRSIGMARA